MVMPTDLKVPGGVTALGKTLLIPTPYIDFEFSLSSLCSGFWLLGPDRREGGLGSGGR